jgi:hypothetical protein
MKLKSIFLFGFVISFALVLLSAFLYFDTMNRYNAVSAEDLSETVYGDDIAITFLSTSPLYHSGENLDFQIHVDNQGAEFIFNIDFLINVRSLSIFDVKIFTKEHYSDRGFEGNSIDIIEIGSRGHMDVTLPSVTPSGIYELELVATPENRGTLPPAKVKMFVIQSPGYIYLYFFGMFLFFVLYEIQIAYGDVIRLKTTEVTGAMQKDKIAYYALMEQEKKETENIIRKPFYFFLPIKFILYEAVEKALPLINELQEIDRKLKASCVDFSIGQKFVFGGICLLVSTAVVLSAGLSMFAEKFAILAYCSLVIGIFNILFEDFQESRDSKTSINVNLPLRVYLSLLIFIFLIIFSISEFGITMALASIVALIVISYYLILGEKRTDLP